MSILAIDPGHYNNAYCILDPETREVLDSGVVHVSTPHMTRDSEVAESCAQLLIELQARHPAIARLVIEYQGMGRAMTVVESSFLAAAVCCGIDKVECVHPISVKAFYSYLGCRGNRQNKKDAEALIVAMGYRNYVSHIADCILMANYVLDS